MAAVTGAIIAGVGLAATTYQTYKSNQAAKGMQAMSEEQYKASQIEKQKQQKKLEKQKDVYRSMKFENPYENLENRYAGLQTSFENVYEDLTVSTGAADFQMEQGSQQRANIMRGLRGAAGGSGIAALAQSLANQGTLQARQVSVDIGQQEQRNQMARAAGAASARQLGMGREQLIAQGQGAVDMARMGGEAMLQEAETSRQATLLGMEQGSMAGANAAVQQAMSNQMSSMANQMQMHSDAASTYGKIGMEAAASTDWGSFGGGGGGGAATIHTGTDMETNRLFNETGGANATFSQTNPGPQSTVTWDPKWSDRKLKKNIKKISESHSGLNIYSFEFKDSKYGEGLFQGVMSDEVPQDAVGKRNGYDTVDYSKLDVEFKQI